jgi:hypothetical protein
VTKADLEKRLSETKAMLEEHTKQANMQAAAYVGAIQMLEGLLREMDKEEKEREEKAE